MLHRDAAPLRGVQALFLKSMLRGSRPRRGMFVAFAIVAVTCAAMLVQVRPAAATIWFLAQCGDKLVHVFAHREFEFHPVDEDYNVIQETEIPERYFGFRDGDLIYQGVKCADRTDKQWLDCPASNQGRCKWLSDEELDEKACGKTEANREFMEKFALTVPRRGFWPNACPGRDTPIQGYYKDDR